MSCGNNCAVCKCDSSESTIEFVKSRLPSKEEINSYYDGVIEGIHMYSWWKDGVSYVGTTGKTYKAAFNEINEERNKALSKHN